MALPEFVKHLEFMNAGKSQKQVTVQGAGRALGMLKESGDIPITDVKVLVGFYLHQCHYILLELPLLQPKYFWTADLLEGLCNNITFHLLKMKEARVLADSGLADKYRHCLELLVATLKAGFSKRGAEFKEKALREKGRDDLYVLNNFP